MDSNRQAVDLGYNYVREHFSCPLPIRLEAMDKTKDSILIDGNTASGLGCVYAGATVGAWYPITPATSLMEAFTSFCRKYRRDPETKANKFAILQAEDEIAAVGMVIVSGRIQGETETATLRVQERYDAFDLAGAYAISIVLALVAILVLVAMTVIRPKETA